MLSKSFAMFLQCLAMFDLFMEEQPGGGNVKITEKIDGIVASIMALDRCIRNQGEEQGSVYDNRGILVL